MKKKQKAPVGLVAALMVLVGIAVFFQLASMGVFSSKPGAGAEVPAQTAPTEAPKDESAKMAENLKSGTNAGPKVTMQNGRPDISPGEMGAGAPGRPTIATPPQGKGGPATRPKPNDNSISGQWWEKETNVGSR